jgi:hypothetical protein
MHRAGPTSGHAAAEFRAGQFQFVADYPQQRGAVFVLDRDGLSIQAQFTHVVFPYAEILGRIMTLISGYAVGN